MRRIASILCGRQYTGVKMRVYYLLCAFFLTFCLTFPGRSFAQSLVLTGTNMGPDNYIKLDWSNTLPGGSDTYRYTLYQWDQVLSSWQTTSTNYDKTIKVLNIYPGAGNNLKTWMETNGYGLGKILVTEVTLANFNANPNGYLQSSGVYQYDAIMFGSWDSNNSQDLNAASAAAVAAFLQTGRGVLFGHDTQYQGHPNFASLKDWSNLYINPSDALSQHWRGSNVVKVVNDGYLLKYPHVIPYNVNLTIPLTHSTGQFAKGVVWMNFPSNSGSFTGAPTIVGEGTNDFYLTTWNNAAMIQTGHSSGAATPDEQRIIANTLWYLAQFTTDTQATVRSALDLTDPVTESAARNSTDCGKVIIKGHDNGSAYKFRVVATSLSNSSVTYTSNDLSVENITGLKGYYIIETDNPAQGDITAALTPAADNQLLTYDVADQSKYVHIQAVDYAGNRSLVTTLEPIPTFSYPVSAYCPIGTVTPTRTGPTGGTFSVTPASGLSINSTSGAINLAASTPGTYTVTYNYPTGCTPATATVAISALPVITIENATVNEGDNLSFTVRLTGGHCSADNVTVSYTTINETATSPADYTTAGGTLVFAPGETEKKVILPTVGNDLLVEGNETMRVRLSGPVNSRLLDGAATLDALGTVVDMTDGTIIVEKYKPTSSDASEPLVHGSFRVRFKEANVKHTKDITVGFALVGADNPTDYEIVTGVNVTATSATIMNGNSEVEIPIKIHNNCIVQGDRRLKIEITGILP